MFQRLFSRIMVVAFALSALAPDCGDEPKNNGGNDDDGVALEEPEMWQQLFTTWTCTAAGRPTFQFEAVRLSEFGSDHEWIDFDTGNTLPAYVSTTDAYLKNGDGSAFRNFEMIPNEPDVLDHLEEWTVTAGADAPYFCTTP